jgi:hypothetical protein
MIWWMIAIVFYNGNFKGSIIHEHSSRAECLIDAEEQKTFYTGLRGTVQYYCIAENYPELPPTHKNKG